MIKLVHCLRRKPGLSLEEFQVHWLQHHARLEVGDRPIRRYVQYHRLVNDPIYESMAQADGAVEEPYDGLGIYWYDDATIMAEDLKSSPEVAAAREDEAHFIDAGGSTTCLVEERVVIEPNRNHPVTLIECLRRRSDIDRQTFHDIWDDHAKIGRRANKMGLLMGYIQNTSLLEGDDRWSLIGADPVRSWDGVVTAYVESIAKLKTLLTSPLAAEESFEDEKRFIDHAQSSYLTASRHVIKDLVR